MLSFECVSSVLGYYESVWQAREAVQHNPICMYDVGKHRHNIISGEFGNVLGTFGGIWLERLESTWIV